MGCWLYSVNGCVTLLNPHRDQMVSANNPILIPIIRVPAPRKTTTVHVRGSALIKPTEPHHLQKVDKLSLRCPQGHFSPYTKILSMFITNMLQTRPHLGVRTRFPYAPHLMNSHCCCFWQDNRCGSHDEI